MVPGKLGMDSRFATLSGFFLLPTVELCNLVVQRRKFICEISIAVRKNSLLCGLLNGMLKKDSK